MFRRRICCENHSEYSLWDCICTWHVSCNDWHHSWNSYKFVFLTWLFTFLWMFWMVWYCVPFKLHFFFRRNQNAKFDEWWRRGCVDIRNSVLWGKNSHNEYDMYRCIVMQQELILVFIKVWSDHKILCNSLSLTFK
jgi:hypothetical protein